MKHFFSLLFLLQVIKVAHSLPSPATAGLSSTLLLNAPGYQSPDNPNEIIAEIESFVYLTETDYSPFRIALRSLLKEKLHAMDNNLLETAVERTKFFPAIPVPNAQTTISLTGCTHKSTSLPRTGIFKNIGFVSASASVCSCTSPMTNSHTIQMTANANNNNLRGSATVFFSPPTGLGVISDIDDTVKVSNVLDKNLMLSTMLYNEPVPVSGMPELYASLAQSLPSKGIKPHFMYLSGSPFQLFPFLSSFLESKYPTANGPILLRPFSITNPKFLFDLLWTGPSADKGKVDYKVSQIERVHKMYPQKSFLFIGDSGEQDAEAYGKAYHQFGETFVRCIWIRLVKNAPNDGKRFSTALKGVPKTKYRLFEDHEIPGLAKIDVAGGRC